MNKLLNKPLLILIYRGLSEVNKRYHLIGVCNFIVNYFTIKKLLYNKLKSSLYKHQTHTHSIGETKYTDVNYWVFECLLRCYRLGLHIRKNLKILDIGTGAGYFPFICNYFGHHSQAIDLPDSQMYNDFCKDLAIHRHLRRIESFKSLEISERYDVITAFMICFNNHKRSDLWHIDEWQYFLKDLSSNNLNENGRIHVEFNSESTDNPINNELLTFFRSRGADIYDLNVDIQSSKYRFE